MDEIPSKRKAAMEERRTAYKLAFASALDAAIDSSDYTAEDVAYLTSTNTATLSSYRRGKQEPGVGKAAMLAEVLGVPLSDMLRDASEKRTPPAATPGATVEEEVSRGTGEKPRAGSRKRSGQARKR